MYLQCSRMMHEGASRLHAVLVVIIVSGSL